MFKTFPTRHKKKKIKLLLTDSNDFNLVVVEFKWKSEATRRKKMKRDVLPRAYGIKVNSRGKCVFSPVLKCRIIQNPIIRANCVLYYCEEGLIYFGASL